ncbi:MAG TPA: four helix bundle protein [Candidatus Binatia bacterium]|nr:four helix bundle protein [Candidatus Binatia bacterium]
MRDPQFNGFSGSSAVHYQRFEDLPVWHESADLARLMFEFTSHGLFRQHLGLRDQLERAALSISNNIAEGFERGSNNELLAFLYIARGSAGEVRSMCRVLESWQSFTDHKVHIEELRKRAELISRQLHGWIEQIKRSGLRGQRHLNVVKSPKPSQPGESGGKPNKNR